eukprot:gene11099-23200_t
MVMGNSDYSSIKQIFHATSNTAKTETSTIIFAVEMSKREKFFLTMMENEYQLPLEAIGMQSPTDEDDMYGQPWGRGSEKCNLIINYLPQDINDNALRSLFSEVGEISQAKVVRDKATKKSLGYGFVKYLSEEDAHAAIMQMNGFPLGHKKLKVSLARAPSDDIRNCKLYVTNLPRSYTEFDVAKLFSQFGDIIECRVLRDKNSGANKGVAFVQFNVRAEANRALSLNGHRVEGVDRPLTVKYAEDQHKKKEKRPMPMMPGRFRQEEPYLFPVEQLPNQMMSNKPMGYNVNNGQAYLPATIGSQYGGPLKFANSPTGPGRVSMEWFGQMPAVGYDSMPILPHSHGLTYEPVEIDIFNQQQREASTVFMTNPRVAQDTGYSNNAAAAGITVVLSRLPTNADVSMLQDLFSPYGRIISAHIEVDEYGQAPDGRYNNACSGRAYIQMESLVQAQNAVQALNGLSLFQREGLGPLQADILYGRPQKLVS